MFSRQNKTIKFYWFHMISLYNLYFECSKTNKGEQGGRGRQNSEILSDCTFWMSPKSVAITFASSPLSNLVIGLFKNLFHVDKRSHKLYSHIASFFLLFVFLKVIYKNASNMKYLVFLARTKMSKIKVTDAKTLTLGFKYWFAHYWAGGKLC